MRPSVVFGPNDDFFNRFAALARMSPALPLVGGGTTRFQPVYAGDVAEAMAKAVAGETKPGTVYELGGPEVMTFKELMQYVLATIERRRLLVPIPFWLAKFQALFLRVHAQAAADAGPGRAAAVATVWCRTRRAPKAARWRGSASCRARRRRSCRPISGASARPASSAAASHRKRFRSSKSYSISSNNLVLRSAHRSRACPTSASIGVEIGNSRFGCRPESRRTVAGKASATALRDAMLRMAPQDEVRPLARGKPPSPQTCWVVSN